MGKARIDPARLDAANQVLATFRRPEERYRLEYRGELYLAGPGWTIQARLRGDGLYLFHRNGRRYLAGTEEMAACQLVRWLRDQPRRGRPFWDYMTRPAVGLGNAWTAKLLADAGYFDAAKTACVLCGAPAATDWWSLDDVTGPCCSFGTCRKGVLRAS